MAELATSNTYVVEGGRRRVIDFFRFKSLHYTYTREVKDAIPGR